MAKMNISLQHNTMLTTSKVEMIDKGIEQLYYSLLFSTPAYNTRRDKWTQWLKMGFEVAVREQPRASTALDQLRIETFSDGHKTVISLVNGNDQVLKQYQQLLSEIEGARKSKKDPTASLEAAMSLTSVRDKLIKPMSDSMSRDGLQSEEVADFLEHAQEAISTFASDANLASMEVGGVPANAW